MPSEQQVESICPESGLCIFFWIRSQSSIWVSSGTCIHIVIQIHIQSQRYAMLCNKGGTGTKTANVDIDVIASWETRALKFSALQILVSVVQFLGMRGGKLTSRHCLHHGSCFIVGSRRLQHS